MFYVFYFRGPPSVNSVTFSLNFLLVRAQSFKIIYKYMHKLKEKNPFALYLSLFNLGEVEMIKERVASSLSFIVHIYAEKHKT